MAASRNFVMEIKLLESAIPKDLKRAKFEDLIDPAYDYSKCVLIGKIYKHWPPAARSKPGSLLKCLIAEVTSDGTSCQEKVTLYFYDKFATEAHPLSCDTYIAFTGFKREPLTVSNPNKELLPYQLFLRPREEKNENGIRPEIWILRSKDDCPTNMSTEHSQKEVPQSKSDVPVSTHSLANSSVKSSPRKPTKSRCYSYKKLGELKECSGQKTKYNVFGLVVTCEMKTSGNQHPYMTLFVSDETHEKLKCVILGKPEDIFPDVCCGDVVRIHRMQVNEYRNTLQGKCFSPKDVVVFKNTVDSNIAPSTSASTYTYSEEDKKRAEELRNWRRESNYKTFSQITYGNYANVLCQVASVTVVSTDTVILRVWDGTEPTCVTEPFKGQIKSTAECPELLQSVRKFLVDVRLYDCHAKSSMNIQPKQFIELSNIHLLSSTTRRGAMFYMHSGTDHNRYVSVLADDHPVIQPLKVKLEDILKNNTPTTQANEDQERSLGLEMEVDLVCDNAMEEQAMDFEFFDSDCFMADLEENLQAVYKKPNAKKPLQTPLRENAITQSDKDISLPEKDSSRLLELPLRKEKWWIRINASTDNDHEDIDPTFIKDVLKHEVPFRFRIFASVVEIFPSVEKVRNFVYVFCPICDFLSPEAEMTKNSTSVSNCVYCCPNCSKESIENQSGTSSSTFFLEYTILAQFLLQDGTAQLRAFLWKENAIEFFREIKPEHLLNENSIEAQSFREILWQLCPNIKPPSSSHNSDEPYPIIDCCIFSYTASDEVNYQISDTRVI